MNDAIDRIEAAVRRSVDAGDPNSIAMWDNRNTQHRVIADNVCAHRRMERVTICGDEPF